MFDINTLIHDKLNSNPHKDDEINFIINSYLSNNISDEDMTKWLKAIYNHNMNIDHPYR